MFAADAAKQDKHLFVWLHETDCGYCEAMQEFTLDDDSIKSVVQASFMFVPINVSEDAVIIHKAFKGSGKAFAKKLGYNFYPSSLFLNADADIVFAAPGFIKKRDFLEILESIRSSTKKMNYDSFQRHKGKQL